MQRIMQRITHECHRAICSYHHLGEVKEKLFPDVAISKSSVLLKTNKLVK